MGQMSHTPPDIEHLGEDFDPGIDHHQDGSPHGYDPHYVDHRMGKEYGKGKENRINGSRCSQKDDSSGTRKIEHKERKDPCHESGK